jgi:hypothetical protein
MTVYVVVVPIGMRAEAIEVSERCRVPMIGKGKVVVRHL